MVERRGRPSSADLETVTVVGLEKKPDPPEDMSDAEKAVWVGIVSPMPVKFFTRECWPLLISLCRHKVAADALWARYIEALETKKKVEILETLSRLHNRETAAVRRLSADLRHLREKENQVHQRPWDL